MTLPFKKYVNDIHPYEPGKPIEEVERELGLSRVVKLASNENPLGASKKAQQAIRQAAGKAQLYPDGGCFYLKKKLAQSLKVSAEQLIIGNGSNEIIELLARGFLNHGDRVVTSELSFLVYPLITKVCGAELKMARMQNFRYALDGILALINAKTKLVFIANPNNPTGTYVTQREVEQFLKQIPAQVLVCFDEAYFDFVEAKDFPNILSLIRQGNQNVMILRTFSKSYGLAGLRIGYGIGVPLLIRYLDKVRQPFNVNQLAQVAATAALSDQAFLKKTKQTIAQGRQFFYAAFKKMGLTFTPSQANFVLMDVKKDANQVFQNLLKKGVIVRSMAAYGLNTYLRVSVGTPTENKIFIRALQEVL